MDGVEISNCGHQDTERACLDIKFVLKGDMSTFKRNSIHDGFGWGINVFSSEFVTIENNVFYNTEKFSTRALFSNNFYYKKNLMIGIVIFFSLIILRSNKLYTFLRLMLAYVSLII